MSDSILVAYATRYGSTQEVAEAVAATLRESGLEVDIQPMRKVRALASYRAVVIGAPIYIGSLHKDAQRFLSQHREALSERYLLNKAGAAPMPPGVGRGSPTSKPRNTEKIPIKRSARDGVSRTYHLNNPG